MRKLVLIIIAIAICGAAVWLGTKYRPSATASVGPDATTATTTNRTADDAGAPAPEGTGKTPRVFQRHPHAKTGDTEQTDIWDSQIDAILASQAPDAEIADKLLKLYPQMPTNAQADLFLEITPRVTDENYSKLSGILTNSTTTGEVLDTLLNDLVDRPDKIRLPVFLDVMRTTDNPKSPDAHDLLEAILGEDYGVDWDTWSKKISEWMTAHPE